MPRESSKQARPGDYAKRYGDACDSTSVDHRRNMALLNKGEIPNRFRELVSFVPGDRIVDLGAGEGILGLALCGERSLIRSIDLTPVRYEAGLELLEHWRSLGRDVSRSELVLGDALANPELLDGFDTLVASRVIYYFRERIDPFMTIVSQKFRYVVLVGNGGRNKNAANGKVPKDIGPYITYSTPEGMRELLVRHGFEIISEGTADGDPVVVGRAL